MSVAHSPQRGVVGSNGQLFEEQDGSRNLDEEWIRLRREREELEKLRAELEKTKTSSIAANTRSRSKKNVDKGMDVVYDNAYETERRYV